MVHDNLLYVPSSRQDLRCIGCQIKHCFYCEHIHRDVMGNRVEIARRPSDSYAQERNSARWSRSPRQAFVRPSYVKPLDSSKNKSSKDKKKWYWCYYF